MPRRLILSATERDTLLALPESQDDLIRYYTFNDSDLSLIRQRRGDANRLGFAVQLCLLRYPGYALGTDSELPEPVILWVAKQVQAEPASWAKYGERDVTRREHAQELRTYLQLAPFGLSDFRALVRELTELAQQTDKGLLLAGQALESLRQKRRILPALSVIDRACSEAIARANRRVYRALVEPLTDSHRAKLDELLKLKAGSSITWLTWLRQAPLKPNSRHMLEHIERLKTFQLVDLPEGLGRHIHQNRLLKLAREGGQMTPKDLGKFEPQRRYATLAAVVLESTATVIDELVDLHDRILVKLFSGAKHKHQQQFQKQGKAINDKVRLYSRIGQALLEAKESGSDPYAAIEAVIPWDEFTESVSEAELLARPEGFDHLHLVGENFATLRRYTPALLEVLELRYGERDVTRREHAQELRTYLQLAPFGLSDFRALVRELTELAQQTDKGLLLAGQALESLRQKRRILPALSVIDRACSEAIARANRRVYRALVEPLTDSHRAKLDELLKLKAGSSITWLTWLRQAPLKPNSRHMLEHIERLKTFQLVDLPEGLGRHIHQNRLLKLAREGGQMTPKDLGKFEPQRRYATLAAVVLESTATVIDELVDLHDRILVKLFSGAKHKHQQQFQKQGKAINDKVRLYSRIGQALLEAKESGSDPYAAIEAVIPWDEFTESVSEAELLARPEGFDHLHLVGENFATLRRYTPALLEVLELRAAPGPRQGVWQP
ncbi:DUF4158 domain-containing protein (plasmid) [Klebsiella pneumoniae]